MRFLEVYSFALVASSLVAVHALAPLSAPLSKASIPDLAKQGLVRVPNFDPSDLTAGILQIGVSNFFRSHFCAYMDDVLNDPALLEDNKCWGIVGAGLYSPKKRDILQSQDWMQTMVERDGTSAKASLLASMIDYLPTSATEQKHEALQDQLCNNGDIKIVSLTITEGGYYLYDGAFNPNDPAIQDDISNPETPQTVFGMMVKGLKDRRDSGISPFTVMSCDNIPHNGDVVKSVVVGLAKEMKDPELVEWIEENVSFPNSMVDRITPGTTAAMRTFVQEQYGIEDVSPIFCEPFRQWVLEDKFCQGRPDWDKLSPDTNANIIFTDDVGPYEHMKIRILNGGHASLCYPSALLGVEYVHNAMEHALIGPFLDKIENYEIMPTVPPVPDTVLTEYWTTIAERFSNPTIDDTIVRNCYDGASRHPKFIVPVARDALQQQGADAKIEGLALVAALWCRYCQGTTEAGDVVEDNDPQWDRLQGVAEQAKTDPSAWLNMKDVYGDVVGQSPVFNKAFAEALNTIQTKGVEGALQKYIDSSA